MLAQLQEGSKTLVDMVVQQSTQMHWLKLEGKSVPEDKYSILHLEIEHLQYFQKCQSDTEWEKQSQADNNSQLDTRFQLESELLSQMHHKNNQKNMGGK